MLRAERRCEVSPKERINFVVNRAFGGWHHVQNRKPNAHGVQFNVYGDISTCDYDTMTKLVVACHAVHVRAQISPCNPQLLRVYLHPRVTKDVNDNLMEYHPSTQDLIARCEEEEARAKA